MSRRSFGTLDPAMKERIKNEEYKIWKKETPFLYDFIMSDILDWPSLTCQWLPEAYAQDGQDSKEHRLILGTHSLEESFLIIASVCLPTANSQYDASAYDTDTDNQFGGFGLSNAKLKIESKIKHIGDVNRARYMPQNPYIIATQAPSNELLIFDYSKHQMTTEPFSDCRPQLRLRGHQQEGYGISWNPFEPGHLLSSSDDSTVCLFDINSKPRENRVIEALNVYKPNDDGSVEDVDWNCFHANLFGTVDENESLMIWDTRFSSSKPCYRTEAHVGPIHSISFNPFIATLLATGAADKSVALWDLRNLKYSLYSFISHAEEVFEVEWSPHNETVLASASSDGRVHIWDSAMIGKIQDPQISKDGPPELLFIHAGHTDKVPDIAWNSHEPWMLCSVSANNQIQIWQMAENFYFHDEINN